MAVCTMRYEEQNARSSIVRVLGILSFLSALFWHAILWIAVAGEIENFQDANGVPVARWP